MQFFSLEKVNAISNSLDGRSGGSAHYVTPPAKETEENSVLLEFKLDEADLSPSFISKIVASLSKYNAIDEENINIDAFTDIARAAQLVENQGNIKPKILVESMVEYIIAVETALNKGEKFSNACVKAKNVLPKVLERYSMNLPEKPALGFGHRWEYLAVKTTKEKLSLMEQITPETNMSKTNLPIILDSTDYRDMLEFLRKNWHYGNHAYKIIKYGSGFSALLRYWREEFFPQYLAFDIYKRKH